MIEDPLAALRPLHAPAPVSWWPPAPGWWVLLLFAVILITMIYGYRKRTAPQRTALYELKQLSIHIDTIEQPAAALNQLLKRYALICWPAKEVAALSGQDWLVFLDANGGNGKFSRGPGQLLLYGPYQQQRPDLSELLALARLWIKTNAPPRKSYV